MPRFAIIRWQIVLGVVLLTLGQAMAQQTATTAPMQGVSHGFSERMGTSWAARGKGWNLSFGGPAMVMPPFGPFVPGAGLSGGVSFGSGGALRFDASQGSRRSATGVASSITGVNGMPGGLFAGSYRPFVVGYIPVVGGYGYYGYGYYGYGYYSYGYYGYGMLPGWPGFQYGPSTELPVPLAGTSRAARALGQLRQTGRLPDTRRAAPKKPARRTKANKNEAKHRSPQPILLLGDAKQPFVPTPAADSSDPPSSAERPAPSVARARALYLREQAAGQRQAEEHFRRAQQAEASGKTGLAKGYYQMAAQRADGPLKRRALDRLLALRKSPPNRPKPER